MKPNSTYILLIFCRWILAQACYFPDNKGKSVRASLGYRPCSSNDTTYSICCNTADRCFSQGVCSDSTGTGPSRLYRGGCTDENWYNCPDICLSKNGNASITIKLCESTRDYCCQSASRAASNCCMSADERFSISKIPRISDPSSRKVPVGAIAGGVAGGVIGLIGLVGLCFVVVMHRRGKKRLGNQALGGKYDHSTDKSSTVIDPSLAEADAGPGSVLVESDSKAIRPKTVHELPA
ncbi:unnamed protein product [Fusarium venenatum]|uniref:Mid2 domain-containing protein n=2 Tax=Fusarium venenatum TaxID=56646 RepID=A0A2L2SSX6_9HYPO|nr:uncharacterized protein FVRRES_11146 [Fusarium venenatum]CEI38455.1 unnamed protein product [Fusarium venenatum]